MEASTGVRLTGHKARMGPKGGLEWNAPMPHLSPCDQWNYIGHVRQLEKDVYLRHQRPNSRLWVFGFETLKLPMFVSLRTDESQ